MEIDNEKIRYAVTHTEILRAPKQSLYTFGTTNIYYYLLTSPAYSELIKDTGETVIREGRVIAERPKIVTPYYLSRLEGFGSEAKRYFETLITEYGDQIPGLLYTYRNESRGLNIVSDNLLSVVERLNAEIDKRSDRLAAIIKGEDALWDVSLLKFIFEITRNSAPDNLRQLGSRGLLNTDAAGIPAAVRASIEELFAQVMQGEREPNELREELNRWGLFKDYKDRFFSLFLKK